jgi:simple sugar transport system permease protein
MTLLITFIQKAIGQGVAILFGASGEIMTEKSGNLNLGIPGIMYMGGISGLMGAFFYENAASANGGTPNGLIGCIIALLCTLIASAFGGLIYSFLTITLRANQNVVGLALTTFGVGFGNFFGGSISKLAGGVGQISVQTTAAVYRTTLPGLSQIPIVGSLLFSYGFLTYLSIILAIVLTYFLKKTRTGLNLVAVGEDPATADAAGIDVSKYKYLSTVGGAAIAGLGGLYFVMEYLGGTWSNNGFGDRGWLAIALVILALWNPANAIWGSFVFGGLYILYIYMPGLTRATQELFKMLPYVVTIIVLVLTSKRNKLENQPPASLGEAYFREER